MGHTFLEQTKHIKEKYELELPLLEPQVPAFL